MRVIGFIVAVAIAMVALKLAAAVVALLIVGALVWSAIARPKETFGWLAGFTALELASQHPLPAMIAIGVLVLAGTVGSR